MKESTTQMKTNNRTCTVLYPEDCTTPNCGYFGHSVKNGYPPLKTKPLQEHQSNRWAGCTTCDKDGTYGPSHSGSKLCRNGTSLAAGGHVTHCTCAACF